MIIKFPSERVTSLPLKNIIDILNAGDTDEGLSELKRFIHKYPEDSEGWTTLGHVMNSLEDLNKSLHAYSEAIRLAPDNTRALTGLGIVYRKLNNDEAARSSYLKALAIEPENPWALTSLSVIELRYFEDTSALEHALKAYHILPSDPNITANLSVAYHYTNNYKKRDKLLNIAINQGYTNAEKIKKFFTGEMTIRAYEK